MAPLIAFTITMVVVALRQTGIIDVEGIAVLHQKLAAAQEASAGTGFVAVLGLNLVQRYRQVFVARVQVLDKEGEHLFVGWPQKEFGSLAVLQTKEVVAIFGPATSEFVDITGKKCREVHFLGSHGIHLIANDGFDLAQNPPTKGEPGVSARGGTANESGSQEEAVARYLSV
jgi:hypothetical protein